MKKYLLPLLLAVAFLFFGYSKAVAANTFGLSTATLSSTSQPVTATNICMYGFYGGTTSTKYLCSYTFAATTSAGTISTYFTNFRLYRNTTTDNYNTTGSTTATNVTTTTPLACNFTISGNTLTVSNIADSPSPYPNAYYYYIVADLTAPSTLQTFSLALNGFVLNAASNASTPLAATGPYTGATYNLGPVPPAVSASNITSGLNPTSGSNIYYNTTNYLALAGISLTANTATTPVTQIVFSTSSTTATDGNYLTAPVLYSSSSPTFSTSTASPVAGATLLTPVGTSTYTFNITGTATGAKVGTATIYYYLVTIYSGSGTVPQTLYFAPSSYTTGYSGTVSTGYGSNSYNCAAPTLTINTNTGGLASTTITGNESNIAIFGLSAASSGSTASITSFTFTTSAGQIITNYFPTVTLYSSNNATYGSGTLTSLGTQTPSSTATSVTFPVTGQTIATGVTTYYYLVVSYTETGSAPPPSFQFNATTVVSTPIATLSSTAGQSYTFSAASYNWVGGSGSTAFTRSDWNTAANWSPANVPGPYDAASIGVTYYRYQPVVSTGTATAGSITFGSDRYFIIGTLTVNTGATLNITGDITYLADDYADQISYQESSSSPYLSPVQEELLGGGTVSAVNLNVTSTFNGYAGSEYAYALYLQNNGVTLNLSGNINLTSNAYTSNFFGFTTLYPYNAYFVTQAGVTTVNGLLKTTNANTFGSYGTSGFSIVPLSATPVTNLQLANTAAFSLSANGTNTVVFNNPYSLVTYSGAAQTVYTDKAITGLATGPSYYNLAFSGTGIKTPNSTTSGTTITGKLNIAGDFTNSLTNDASNYLALSTSAVSSLGTPVLFNGTNAPESLAGGVGTGTVFRNVSFSNTQTATMTSGSFSVIDLGTLTMLGTNVSTILKPGGILTLNSDATGTATIATIPGGPSIQGIINAQRYVTASRGYRMFASPVNKITYAPSNTSTSANVLDLSYFGATVNGNYGAYFGGPGIGFTNPINNSIIYLYDEAIVPGKAINSTFYSSNYVGVYGYTAGSPWEVTTKSNASGGTTAKDNNNNASLSTSAIVIPAGNGLLYYYIGNSQQATLSSAATSSTVTATGYPNQGLFPLYFWGVYNTTLTSTFSFTSANSLPYETAPPGTFLIGNPYPATLDLQKLFSDNYSTTVGNATFSTSVTFHQLDIVSQNFDDYNANGLSSGTATYRYLLSGQGVLLTFPSAVSTGVASNKPLYFNEDQKVLYANASFPTQVNMAVTPRNAIADEVAIPVIEKQTAATLLSNDLTKVVHKPTASELQATRTAKLADNNVNVLNVKATAAPTPTPVPKTDAVRIINTAKVVVDSVAGAPICGLHLKLVKDSVNTDQCGIYFNKTWSDKLDGNDSRDLDGEGSKVFLSSYSGDDFRTSINALSSYTNNRHVKLYVKFTTAGLYKLQMSDIKGVDTANYSVFLLDKTLSDSLDLTLYKSYNFNYTPGTANDSTRFVLAIEHKPVPYYALLRFAGQKVTPGVQLNWQTKNNGNKTTFVLQKLNASNVYVSIDSLQSDSSGDFSYIDQHPTLGNNVYRLKQTNELGKITYSAPVTIGYNSTSPNGGLTIYPNPSKDIITVTLSTSSTATTVATADIYNMSGTLVEHKAVSSNSFTYDISSYHLGVYIIELKNSNGFLVGKSKFVKVN